jgi:hypothetical protein
MILSANWLFSYADFGNFIKSGIAVNTKFQDSRVLDEKRTTPPGRRNERPGVAFGP